MENQRAFYDSHSNFANRSLTEYNISPGIKAKFDTIIKFLGEKKFEKALDIGCSGNSILHFIKGKYHRIFCDLAYFPLLQYSRYKGYFPTSGSITEIPFRSGTFDGIFALDVLEHVPKDKLAADEIIRVLKKNGNLIVTVPHRMKYYSYQDQLCGHMRRYEFDQIKSMFTKRGLTYLTHFPVYGMILKSMDVQGASPEKTEGGLNNLRNRYAGDAVFRKLWDKFVDIGSKVVKLEAKIEPLDHVLDVCVVFKK
jgi:SAM-dependent methyltransferase